MLSGRIVSLVELVTAPTPAVFEPSVAAWLGDNAATDASIARYLAAGERTRVIADAALKICVALVVLLIAAWAIGILPGAARPF